VKEIELGVLSSLQRLVGRRKQRRRMAHPRIQPADIEIVAEIVVGRNIAPASSCDIRIQGVPNSSDQI
jgi:hypothetical protein